MFPAQNEFSGRSVTDRPVPRRLRPAAENHPHCETQSSPHHHAEFSLRDRRSTSELANVPTLDPPTFFRSVGRLSMLLIPTSRSPLLIKKVSHRSAPRRFWLGEPSSKTTRH